MEPKVLLEFPDYLIYPNGKVYSTISFGRWKAGFREGCINKPNGYQQVSLKNAKGKFKWVKVHRLIALAFIPNPDNLPEVNHKDRNKLNNSVENLEWISTKDNVEHSFITGRKFKRITPEICKEVVAARNNGIKIKEICQMVGISNVSCYSCLNQSKKEENKE